MIFVNHGPLEALQEAFGDAIAAVHVAASPCDAVAAAAGAATVAHFLTVLADHVATCTDVHRVITTVAVVTEAWVLTG